MKITASKKDEVLKRKAEYDEKYAAYQERQNQYSKAFNEAEDKVLDPIREYMNRKLSRYDALRFDVEVRRGWGTRTGNKGAEVRISCNDRGRSDDDALRWSYNISLDSDGNVKRESSSWSGLSATTEAQMKSLRQTVSALDFLNDVDWEELIRVDLPEYSDYYDPEDRSPEREDWTSALRDAELEDAIGTDTWFKVLNWGESCPYRGNVWIHPLKVSGSQFTAEIIDEWTMRQYMNGTRDADSIHEYSVERRIRRSSIRLLENDDPNQIEVK